MRKVCVLICEAFHGPKPSGMECRHVNNKEWDDRAENLCWGTKLQNEKDRMYAGNVPRGEKHANAKLTDAQVAEIKSCKGKETGYVVAARYGVSGAMVYMIWKNTCPSTRVQPRRMQAYDETKIPVTQHED